MVRSVWGGKVERKEKGHMFAKILLILFLVETWHKEKLKEAKGLAIGGEGLNSTLLREEAVKVLESNWAVLSEDIGLWIPSEVINQEHEDKPEGVEDTGDRLPVECRAELHTDYDGAAVRWGLTHHKESAADCCQACLDQAKHAKPGEKKCNIWVYSPSETGCYSPDKYEHKHMEFWLKYSLPLFGLEHQGKLGTGEASGSHFPVLANCNDVSNGCMSLEG
ncbi:hypothetical protein V6N13_120901 [Hibiscus sabdariffa]